MQLKRYQWLAWWLVCNTPAFVTNEITWRRALVALSSQLITHWGRMTHTWVGKLTIIGSDNGLLPARRPAITWTNARILFIGLLGTNFSEILIRIQTFSFMKMHLKMSSAKWRPFCSAPICYGKIDEIVHVVFKDTKNYDNQDQQHGMVTFQTGRLRYQIFNGTIIITTTMQRMFDFHVN